MAASPTGLATLAVLLAAGPLVWAIILLARRAECATLLRAVGPKWCPWAGWWNRWSRCCQNCKRPNGAADDDAPGPQAQDLPGIADAAGGDSARAQAGFAGAGSGPLAKQERELLSTPAYVLILLAYAIGIGNVWRFPYMVGKWGGGAFVFAYLVCLLFVAIPLFLMELGMGQHTRRSTTDCFRMIHPRWAGLGRGQGLMLLVCLSYYNVLLAYTCVYLAASLVQPLPWSEEALPAGPAASGSAPERFWRRSVLNQFADGEGQGLGPLQPKLVGGLFAVWALVFLALAFGRRALTRVTWVAVLGPVVLMLVLIVRASQLEGAREGVRFYLGKFDVSLLADPNLWAAACGQILFSLSPGMGSAITLSSYAHPKEDVFRTCMIVALANSTFSLAGGFGIFAILGNLAFRTQRTVADVASGGGTGLVFVAIAEGILTFGEGANAMAVLFFMMVLSLGADTTFAWAETFVCYIDDFCRMWRVRPRRFTIVAGFCAFFFCLGLPFCTRMGSELLDVCDHYVVSHFLLFGCCMECVMFNVSFGWHRLAQSIKLATAGNAATPGGRSICVFWRLSLLSTAPGATGLLFARMLYSGASAPYGGYPPFLHAVGWGLLGLCLALALSTLATRGSSSLPPAAAAESGPAAAEGGAAAAESGPGPQG